MNTTTTLLIIAIAVMLLVIVLQAGTIRKLFKIVRDYKETLQLSNILLELYKKKENKPPFMESSISKN